MQVCFREIKDGFNSMLKYLYRENPRTGSKENGKLSHNVSVAWVFPKNFQGVIDRLSSENRTVFYRIFSNSLRKKKEKKIFCMLEGANFLAFNFNYLTKITDKKTQRLMRHSGGMQHDHYLDFALKLRTSKDHKYIFKSLGYHVYAGLSDVEIAKKFKFYPGQIQALRELFYDFTAFPKAPTARQAYLTQLVDNGVIDDEDRRFYKLVAELGHIGLRALSDYNALDITEKQIVEEYLGNSMLDNVFALNFSVTTMKDAVNFNAVINNLASFHIKKEEVNYYRAKVRNLDASTTRIENDKSINFTGSTTEDETALALIGRLALTENTPPPYKTITQLDD